MANLLGAMIGAAIDRGDGDSGIKGAIVETVTEGAIRLLAPVVSWGGRRNMACARPGTR